MLISISHTEFSTAKPESVWHYWSDVKTWSEWDHGIEWCEMKEGHQFDVGGEALLLPKGAPSPVSIQITECKENVGFTDIGTLGLGSLKVIHNLARKGDGILITHILEFDPINSEAAQIFKKQILPNLENGLPPSVKSLARLAERNSLKFAQGKSE